jgi:hypothetical protein
MQHLVFGCCCNDYYRICTKPGKPIYLKKRGSHCQRDQSHSLVEVVQATLPVVDTLTALVLTVAAVSIMVYATETGSYVCA